MFAIGSGPALAGNLSLPLARGPVAAYHTSTTTRVTAKRVKKNAVKSSSASRRRVASRKTSRRRRAFWNPLLKGSHETLLRENAMIDEAGIPRIEDDDQLDALIENEELVRIPETDALRLNPGLLPDRKYARPVVIDFLGDLTTAYYERFRQPLTITSAVRTVPQQRKLRRHNRNAAPENGEAASSHLSGLTVDLGKRGLTKQQHDWLEQYLKNLKDQNVIEPLEEHRQACFHVMVFQQYADWRQQQAQASETTPEP
jgi:hypothetical protein